MSIVVLGGSSPLIFPGKELIVPAGTGTTALGVTNDGMVFVCMTDAATGGVDVRGIQNPISSGNAPGRVIWLIVLGPDASYAGGNNWTFYHNDPLAAASNRMINREGANVNVGIGSAIGYAYNDDVNLWLQISRGN